MKDLTKSNLMNNKSGLSGYSSHNVSSHNGSMGEPLHSRSIHRKGNTKNSQLTNYHKDCVPSDPSKNRSSYKRMYDNDKAGSYADKVTGRSHKNSSLSRISEENGNYLENEIKNFNHNKSLVAMNDNDINNEMYNVIHEEEDEIDSREGNPDTPTKYPLPYQSSDKINNKKANSIKGNSQVKPQEKQSNKKSKFDNDFEEGYDENDSKRRIGFLDRVKAKFNS